MTQQQILLTVLAEECAETAQRVSKALRFTLDEIQPGQDLTNAQRIVYEFNDILAVMEVLEQQKVFTNIIDRTAIEKKKEKLKKYLLLSQKLNVLK